MSPEEGDSPDDAKGVGLLLARIYETCPLACPSCGTALTFPENPTLSPGVTIPEGSFYSFPC